MRLGKFLFDKIKLLYPNFSFKLIQNKSKSEQFLMNQIFAQEKKIKMLLKNTSPVKESNRIQNHDKQNIQIDFIKQILNKLSERFTFLRNEYINMVETLGKSSKPGGNKSFQLESLLNTLIQLIEKEEAILNSISDSQQNLSKNISDRDLNSNSDQSVDQSNGQLVKDLSFIIGKKNQIVAKLEEISQNQILEDKVLKVDLEHILRLFNRYKIDNDIIARMREKYAKE